MLNHLALPFTVAATILNYFQTKTHRNAPKKPETSFDRLWNAATSAEFKLEWIDQDHYHNCERGYFGPAVTADITRPLRFVHAGRRVVIMPQLLANQGNQVFFETFPGNPRSITHQCLSFDAIDHLRQPRTATYQHDDMLLAMHIELTLKKI